MVLTFEYVDEILKCDCHLKATEQFFPEVSLTILLRVAVKILSVGMIFLSAAIE